MLVDIRPAREGAPRSFSGKVDLSGLRLWGGVPFPLPAEVQGSVRVLHGQTEVDYTVSYILSGQCARCLAPTRSEGALSFSHPVKESPEDESLADIVSAPGGLLDLGALAGADLLLEFTHPLLCKEDCKGLCCQCGTDLNMADCDCAGPPPMSPNKAKFIIKEVPVNGGSKDEG